MRTLLLCVIALCSQVMSMTAQVTGRIEYPHRADYEDQVVLPVDDKGLVIQSFAKDSKEGDSRYLVGIGIYFSKPKKKETFIYNSS